MSVENQELWLVIKTQIAEYKQDLLLNLGFILSLAIATSTLLSILILNHASKQEYQRANAKLTSVIAYYILPKVGNSVSLADFADLRKQGFISLSPVLSFRKTLANGEQMSFKGIDLLALSLASPQLYNSDFVMLGEDYSKSLAIDLNQPLVFENNKSAQIKLNNDSSFGSAAVLDIKTAWELFEDLHDFSYLMVSEMSEHQLTRLEQALPPHLVLQQSWSLDERAGFADALHLNLIALAILAFVVSLFIAFQAANQAWHKRSELMAQLRLLGISLTTIRLALALEAVFLIVVASIVGVFIAVLLVSFLLPILGLTLNQLYNLQSSGYLNWNWQYLNWSLLISSAAVLLALLKQFKLISNRQISFFARQIKTNTTDNRFFIKTSIFACLTLVIFWVWPELNWHHIMVKYAMLLLVGIAFLPLLLLFILKLLTRVISQFRVKFILQDTVNQIARRFLPLAAFYIALTTSIAAALMVNSFESALVKFLDQNLNEDLYVRFKQEEKQALAIWLQQNENVEEFYLYYKGTAKFNTETVAIKTINSDKQLSSIVFKKSSRTRSKTNPKPRTRLITEFSQLPINGCFINEQFALKRNVLTGDMVELKQNHQKFSCIVSGIYYDYGDPGFEITLTTTFALKQLKALTEIGFGIYYKQNGYKQKDDVRNNKEEKIDIQQALIDELAIEDSQIFKPQSIKEMALKVFSQTFLLTQAIAAVLLSIACFGLFLSANNLELARKNDLVVLISLGYSRLALFTHMFSQWLLLAGSCIVLSWPIAILIADALVTKVFPASFGWSMPLVLDFASFSSSSLIGLLCLFPALLIPLRKITVAKG